MKLRYYTFVFVLFLIAFYFITQSPEFIEYWYTQRFYKYYSNFMLSATSFFPFPIGDILYLLVGIYLLYTLVKIYKKYSHWKTRLIQIIKVGIKFSLVFYMLFNLTWALNNYNYPLSHQLGIETTYTDKDLEQLTQKLINQTNYLHSKITSDSLQPIKIEKSVQEILKDGNTGIQNLALQTEWFNYKTLSVKPSLFSLPLTYMGFSGYINPFTIEAQVNDRIPKTTMIVTVSHEISHQLGYAQESEANFIGFLAAYNQDDEKYVYAASLYALRYCLSTLEKSESAKTEKFISQIYPGVMENLIENTLFWNSYKGVTDSFFKFFYGNFLKINNQKEGIRSYNKFVALLINYDKKHALYSL